MLRKIHCNKQNVHCYKHHTRLAKKKRGYIVSSLKWNPYHGVTLLGSGIAKRNAKIERCPLTSLCKHGYMDLFRTRSGNICHCPEWSKIRGSQLKTEGMETHWISFTQPLFFIYKKERKRVRETRLGLVVGQSVGYFLWVFVEGLSKRCKAPVALSQRGTEPLLDGMLHNSRHCQSELPFLLQQSLFCPGQLVLF